MIVIKNIEFYEVDRDPWEILYETHPHEPVWLYKDRSDIPDAVECSVFRELIRGRRFVRPSDHTDIVVGCSKQAEDVLGLMYETWDSMENTISVMHGNQARLLTRLATLKNSSFWTRLKWLFTGVKEV